MIHLITTPQHFYTHKCLFERSDIEFRVLTHDDVQSRRHFVPGTYIFADIDRLSPRSVKGASALYRMLRHKGVRVLNDPARFLGRYGLLRKLHREGINQFNAYRADSFEEPSRWPVFVRAEGDHRTPLSELIETQAELEATIALRVDEGFPITSLLVVEYAAEEVRPGLFRKLSVYRVGDRMIGYTCVHDDQWLVKYGKPGIAPIELYEDEFRLVSDNPYGEEMRRVFDMAGLEYGRVDFGLVDGRPQIYEVNSNPSIELEPKSNGIDLRDSSNAVFRDNFLAALREIDTPQAAPSGRALSSSAAPSSA